MLTEKSSADSGPVSDGMLYQLSTSLLENLRDQINRELGRRKKQERLDNMRVSSAGESK